ISAKIRGSETRKNVKIASKTFSPHFEEKTIVKGYNKKYEENQETLNPMPPEITDKEDLEDFEEIFEVSDD
ncbi:MAG: hypothetical protein AABY22_03885, partial [Nanoarchaeota archaeon]